MLSTKRLECIAVCVSTMGTMPQRLDGHMNNLGGRSRRVAWCLKYVAFSWRWVAQPYLIVQHRFFNDVTPETGWILIV